MKSNETGSRTVVMTVAAIVIAGMFCSSALAQRAWPPRSRGYELVDLGAVTGPASQALAIDESGAVVGSFVTERGERRALLYRPDGTTEELGTLQNGTFSVATAISDDGAWIAGNSGIRPLESPEQFQDIQQGFMWSDGVMESVGALYNPATFNKRFGTSDAQAVNDRGQVVGFSIVIRQGLQSAFLWEDGILTDVGLANETAFNSRALDINDSGQIVGDIVAGPLDSTPAQAVVWEGGVARYLPTPEGFLYSTAVAISDGGEIAGWSGDGSTTTAVLWSGGGVQELGALPGDESSRALAINGRGHVIGWSGAAEPARAFIWRAGVMTDLNALIRARSGWLLLEASDLNDQGMIVGAGLKDGERRAFLLKPRACH